MAGKQKSELKRVGRLSIQLRHLGASGRVAQDDREVWRSNRVTNNQLELVNYPFMVHSQRQTNERSVPGRGCVSW